MVMPPVKSWWLCPSKTDKLNSLMKLQGKLLGSEMFLLIQLMGYHKMRKSKEMVILTAMILSVLPEETD